MILLSACTPSINDHVVAKKAMNVVIDWNSISLNKETCTISKSEEVIVKDISTLSLGSTEKSTIIQVQNLDGSCLGWGFPENFEEK